MPDNEINKPVFTPGEYMHLGSTALWLRVIGVSGPGLLGIVLGIFIFIVHGTASGTQIEQAMHTSLVPIGFFVMLLALLYVAVGCFISWLWYITYQFRVADNAFEIKSGILAKSEIAAPYRQIQDVNLDQSLLYRILGVAVVRIITAGAVERSEGGQTEELLPVLDKNIAEALRSELLKRANIQEVVEVKSAQ